MNRAVLLRAVGGAALGLIYPPRCPFCDEVLGQRKACPACAAAERALRRPAPRLAGSDWMLAGLAGGAAAYRYEGAVRAGVLRLKFRGRACYAPALARRMANALFGCTFSHRGGIILPEALPPAALEYDLVLPVPPSGARAYNPPGLLARELARLLGLPFAPKALYKARATLPQEGLGREQRLTNLIGAFAVRPGCLPENSRVLLVDDVVTTGATLTACAAALRKAGAGEVFAACLAATPPPEQAAGRAGEREQMNE